MFKKILIYLAVALTLALFSAYFFYAGKLADKGEKGFLCSKIEVIILDSTQNDFVCKKDVIEMVKNAIGKNIRNINTHSIEKSLVKRSAIATAQAYIISPDILTISITQRQPVIRLQAGENGFFVDNTGYILPFISNHPLDIPIITGKIPLNLEKGFRGYSENGKKWIGGILDITSYIRGNSYWNSQIEQIDIEDNGDIILYIRSCSGKIIFGDASDIEEKFTKLTAFYSHIVPEEGTDKYKTINLKYKNQIICK